MSVLKPFLPRLAVLAALVLVSFFSSNAHALNVKVSEFTLGNGMKVIFIPDHRAPVVTHMVWYRVGAADEPKGKSGIAHLLEHLMFKGTPSVPDGQFSLIIKRNGGQDNAFTTQDYTAYYQRIAKDRLELVMKMEADRMANLQLSEKDVQTELAVVKEERRMRTDNKPQALLGEQMSAALYLAHPYGTPVIGWMSEVSKLNLADAMAFYRQFYTPANATLVVAGDVTGPEVRALAEKYYGVLKNTAKVNPRKRTQEPEPIAARRVIMRDKRVTSPTWMREYLTVSYATAGKGEAEALDILAQILGEGSTSRLYKALVIKGKTASSAGAWYSGNSLDSGTFGVYGIPANGGNVAAVEKQIDAVLADILKNGVTAGELARAKKILNADSVYSLDSQSKLANIFGLSVSTGQTVSDVLEWNDRISAVTLEDVRKAAAKVLQIRRSVTGILLPAGSKAEKN